jgi:hypothetical protein
LGIIQNENNKGNNILKRLLIFFMISLLFLGCTTTEESGGKLIEKIKKEDIPKKITILFITQPHCPSCEQLEKIMELEKPAQLIAQYFDLKKIYLGEKLPDGLIPPNGTPTVYFLGYKDMALLEPMIGEGDESTVIMFLEDALLEFKNLYGVDLTLSPSTK